MKVSKDLKRILDIAITLTSEKDYAKLLDQILSEAMSISECDAGTLYIFKENKLEFMIMRTISLGLYQGGNGEPIAMMPPVVMDGKSVASYVAINKKAVNIADVYTDESFDWQGPKKYDAITGYRTKSMLVVPLINHENIVIGVLQLLNALDSDGNPGIFDEDDEQIVFSLASEAAISLSNMIMVQQLSDMLNSFVASMTAAIDARTPYNANHTKNVAKYCGMLVDYLNRKNSEGSCSYCLSEKEKEQLIMAAMLHDVGKLITPTEIMNKPDRLDFRLPIMEQRWKYIRQIIRSDYYEGNISWDKYTELQDKVSNACESVRMINTVGFLDDEKLELLNDFRQMSFLGVDGEKVEFITEEEMHELTIRKGTLTAEERSIIEHHVIYTDTILSKINFGDNYSNVRFMAGSHHEYLDGSGYPNKLTAEELPFEVRVMTIMDIYDSLTADDRPYKKAVPKEKAFGILRAMADEGKLDRELVELTVECLKD